MVSTPPPPSEPQSPLLYSPEWCTYSPLPASPIRPKPDPTDDSLPDWRNHIQEMPFLAVPRPRALTPTGFRDQIAQEPNPIALFQESAWFKLPPYIRRDILRLAFGDRRVHMGLSYQSRYEPGQNTEASDAEDSKSWQWFGSICHRPVLENQPPAPMTCGGNDYGPWSDSCKSGDPSQGFIGMTGWLLSCRQNYAETIDAFYSTNTIAMSGEAMITHIPQLLLPQRLAVITSLEIRWPLQKLSVADLFHLDLDQFSLILDMLSPKRFPRLQRLYISFEKHEPRQDFSLPLQHVEMVQKLRAFVKSMPGLRECAFAMPEAIFKHITSTGDHQESYSQVWDSLDGNLHMIWMPFENSYPDPPYHLEDRHQTGFWLLEGSENHYNIPSPIFRSSPVFYSPPSPY